MRRRFFRVLTFTLLLLCVGAWGWSYVYDEDIQHDTGSAWFSLRLRGGGLAFGRSTPHIGNRELVHHRIRYIADIPELVPSIAGFGFYEGRVMYDQLTIFRVPLWFPTLLLAALTAWAWRKRRSEGERGFAVEGVGEATGRPPP